MASPAAARNRWVKMITTGSLLGAAVPVSDIVFNQPHRQHVQPQQHGSEPGDQRGEGHNDPPLPVRPGTRPLTARGTIKPAARSCTRRSVIRARLAVHGRVRFTEELFLGSLKA